MGEVIGCPNILGRNMKGALRILFQRGIFLLFQSLRFSGEESRKYRCHWWLSARRRLPWGKNRVRRKGIRSIRPLLLLTVQTYDLISGFLAAEALMR